MRPKLILTIICAMLPACARYQAAPDAAAVLADVQPAAAIDLTAVAAERARLTASAEVHRRPEDRLEDRLDLLIAGQLQNPSARAAEAALQAALRGTEQAAQAPPPTLSLVAEHAADAVESSPWLFGFALDVPLDYGQRRAARLDAARGVVELARCDLADALWSLRSSLRQELTALYASEQRIELLQQLDALRAARLAVLDRQARAGEIARTDIDRLHVDQAADRRLLAETILARDRARQRIAAALAVRSDALALDQRLWSDFFAAGDTADPAANPGGGYDALLTHPTLLRAVIGYEQSDSDYRLEIARQYPSISIGPGYTWERGLVKLPVSVGLSLPPLDRNRSAIATAAARRDAAGAELEKVYAGIRDSLDLARTSLAGAHQTLHAIRAGDLPAADALAKRADTEFEAGAIGRAVWAQAQIDAVAAHLAEVAAVQQVRDAEGALEDALHRPIEGPELEIFIP